MSIAWSACWPGNCSTVAAIVPASMAWRASGRASKPITGTVSPRPRAPRRPERHVVVRADDRAGGSFDCSAGSVMVSPSARAKFAGLLEDDLDRLLGVDDVVEALLAVDSRRRARLALELEDRPTVRQDLDQVLALELAAADVVRPDVGQRGDVGHVPVDRDDHQASVDRRLDGRRQRRPRRSAR
jgi:hypothetical protein